MFKKITLFLLFFLPFPEAGLFAQKTTPSFKLKKDDWLMVLAKTPTTLHQLRYLHNGRLSNGSDQYIVSLERFRLKAQHLHLFPPIWAGYDSYYPPFNKQTDQDTSKSQYTFEVSPSGTMKWAGNPEKSRLVRMTQISPKNDLRNIVFSDAEPLPRQLLSQITTITLFGIRKPAYPPIVITPLAASFPIAKNTIVQGKLTNFSKKDPQTITINNAAIKINTQGIFSYSFQLTSAEHQVITFGKNVIQVFLGPNDTLSLTANASNFEETLQLSGNAAWNSRFAEEADALFYKFQGTIEKFTPPVPYPEELPAIQYKNNREMDLLIKKYQGKVTAECLSYFRTEWMYLLAEMKLYNLYVNSYRYNAKSKLPFHDFPKNYFLDLDTIPVLMNDFQNGPHYNQHLRWLILFQRNRLQMSGIGNSGSSIFLETYAAATAALKDYPLYRVLYEALENELMKNSWKENKQLKPYYDEYMYNCRDTAFTAPLGRLWQSSEKWALKKPNPISELKLSDSTTIALSKYKGAPFCMIINSNTANSLDQYYYLISKAEYKDVQFLIAQADLPYLFSNANEQRTLPLKNVTYIKIDGDINYLNTLGLSRFDTKAYVFDKWQRVVDAPISVSNANHQDIESALHIALHTERYSSTEKSHFLTILLWIALVILLIFTAIFLTKRYVTQRFKYKESMNKQIKDLEIKAIRAQMNPHFIFNALNSIQSLINSGNIKKSNIYLAKFSVLLRSVLANSEKGMVSLSEELKAVELYCQLEQLRFDFEFRLSIDPEADLLTEIPGMIIQPLAENAVVHGLSAKREKGILEIQVIAAENELVITVSDNGSGFSKDTLDQLSEKGFGLKLVEERMQILSYNNRKASLKFDSSEKPNSGTVVTLTFPID